MARSFQPASFQPVHVQFGLICLSFLSWEIPRLDTAVEVRFYGEAERTAVGKVCQPVRSTFKLLTPRQGTGKWSGGSVVLAVPYDVPIPGLSFLVLSRTGLTLFEFRLED